MSKIYTYFKENQRILPKRKFRAKFALHGIFFLLIVLDLHSVYVIDKRVATYKVRVDVDICSISFLKLVVGCAI